MARMSQLRTFMHAFIEVADVFRAAGPAYRAAHAGHLSLDKLKVMPGDRN